MAQRRLVTIGRSIAVSAVGALGVYVAYYPSDSVAVESGDALWLAVLAVAWLTLVGAVHWMEATLPVKQGDAKNLKREHLSLSWVSRWIDWSAGGLAAWMMVAAFLNSARSDLRMGTNEAWWWVTAAALLVAGRRVLAARSVRASFMVLVVCIAVGMAVDALHQDWISLPTTRVSYQRDPDAVVAAMGIDAPPNSSTRMVLENRLFDGGPTATFALANSLAAVLLLGVIVVSGGLKLGWSRQCNATRTGLIVSLFVLLPALIAVRSRAALVATLLSVAMLWLMDLNRPSDEDRPSESELKKSNRWLQGFVGIVATGILSTIGLAMFGNPEWLGQAPASIAFRLQYWAATSRMMGEHWFLGAGPGNFQSLYNQYRDASMTEQVADPHSFLLETLAAGGPLALGLLLFIFLISVKLIRGRRDRYEEAEHVSEAVQHPVLIGGIVMLVIIWFVGLLTLHAPDFQSHRFAIPVAVGLAWVCRSAFDKLTSHQLDRLYGAGLIAILIHLSVSGGWTVPGVALWSWLLLAALTRTCPNDVRNDNAPRASVPVVAIGLFTLLLLTFMSVRPVALQSWSLSVANAAIGKGMVGKAASTLQRAVDADGWSASAVMLQSDFLRHELIRQNNLPTARLAYDQAVGRVIDRSGPNPAVYRQLATQRLHLYQVFGEPDDLVIAKQYLETALQASPADQWLVAQLAEIAIAEGDRDSATELISRAKVLSEMGNNLERALYLQLLYRADRFGLRAASKPIRISAEERFLQHSP